MEDISYMDMQEKVNDMKKIRDSLFREINSKQIQAQEYRDTISAYEKKMEEAKKNVGTVEALILKRTEELASLDSKNTQEMRTIEAHRRDLVTLREAVNAEQIVLAGEKKAAYEAIEEDRRKLARQEHTLNTREGDLKNREREVAAQLDELSKRNSKADEMLLKAQSRDEETRKMNEEVALKLKQTEKALDEANAKKVHNDSLSRLTDEKLTDIKGRESSLKVAYQEIEVKKREISDKQRDLTIEEHRVREFREKVRNELKYSELNKAKKTELQAELGEEHKA